MHRKCRKCVYDGNDDDRTDAVNLKIVRIENPFNHFEKSYVYVWCYSQWMSTIEYVDNVFSSSFLCPYRDRNECGLI